MCQLKYWLYRQEHPGAKGMIPAVFTSKDETRKVSMRVYQYKNVVKTVISGKGRNNTLTFYIRIVKVCKSEEEAKAIAKGLRRMKPLIESIFAPAVFGEATLALNLGLDHQLPPGWIFHPAPPSPPRDDREK